MAMARARSLIAGAKTSSIAINGVGSVYANSLLLTTSSQKSTLHRINTITWTRHQFMDRGEFVQKGHSLEHVAQVPTAFVHMFLEHVPPHFMSAVNSTVRARPEEYCRICSTEMTAGSTHTQAAQAQQARVDSAMSGEFSSGGISSANRAAVRNIVDVLYVCLAIDMECTPTGSFW